MAALQESLLLRTAAERLSANAASGGTPNPAVVDGTVTLLTLQARALLSPSDSSLEQEAAGSASPPPSHSTAPATEAPATDAPATTLAELASALSASGMQRLTDAATADGGMARLLAGAGTAQLIAAENVAAAGGVPVATLPHAGAGTPTAGASSPAANVTVSACPSPPPVPEDAGPQITSTDTAPVLGNALSAAVAAGQQSIYAYQAALPRLGPDDARTAGTFLGQHQELAEEAAARSREACNAPQAQQPGFVLAPDFLAAPRDGLARLELAALPAYGDIIAKADGDLRTWAIAALQLAARRAAHWNGAVGPVPGVPLDQDQLPDLPASPTPGPTGT